MENYLNIFFLLAHEIEGIELNKNIFETNLINLLLLISLVFYVGKDFLKSTLTFRQRSILDKIEEADKKVSEANKRFFETREKWSQANILETILEKTTLQKIDSFHESTNLKNKDLILKEYFSTIISLNLRNEQAQKQVKKCIIEFALKQVDDTFNKLIENINFQESYSNNNILLLEKLIGEN
jgi:F-type H+-transporting ATPase subunit b